MAPRVRREWQLQLLGRNKIVASLPHVATVFMAEVVGLKLAAKLIEGYGGCGIRWCGIGGFQDQVGLFVGLVALYFFVFNYFPFLFFSSIGW